MSSENLSIYAVGDVIPDYPNPVSLFELALPTLKQADILFGQLDASFSEKVEPQMQNYYARRVNPEKINGLTAAGSTQVISGRVPMGSRCVSGTSEDHRCL